MTKFEFEDVKYNYDEEGEPVGSGNKHYHGKRAVIPIKNLK